ncbi:MAG: response regulator [Anaerolineales bacterium]|jgi:signal transduction histidine kinase
MENGAKLLIIDDEEIVIDSCTRILARGDYDIQTAENGEQGLEILKDFRPDLAFVDLKMPGISGFEVIEKIQEMDPTIVVIVITGFATVNSAVDAMKKGAYDFLPKPFTPDELRLITQRGLEKRKFELETIALRREKEMLREHFAAIVSHELKSPISAVQQNLFVLADELSEKLSEEQQQRFERIQTRINDLVQLIHTWLRVISVDIKEIEKNFKPTSINEVITKAVESVQTHAIRKNIEIVTNVEEPIKMVNGDEGTLVEALVNIIGNAVKYSRLNDQIEVEAKLDGKEIMISVRDTGVGIPKEDIPFIFDDFFISKSAPIEERGSGLGLAITKRIIEAHIGTISVDSKLGKGSTFVIQLPTISEE